MIPVGNLAIQITDGNGTQTWNDAGNMVGQRGQRVLWPEGDNGADGTTITDVKQGDGATHRHRPDRPSRRRDHRRRWHDDMARRRRAPARPAGTAGLQVRAFSRSRS